MNKKELNTLLLLTGIFVFGLTFANIVAGIKLVNILGFVVPSAVLSYAFLTFPITDIIAETYGKETANTIVKVGFASQLVFILFIYLTKILPALEPAMQETYNTVFGMSARIIIASLFAYIISQTHDVYAFHFWKRKTNGKHLWLRNNLSTMTSQAIDTVLFITIAFFGVVPTNILLNMIASQYIVKLLIAASDTPIVYIGSHIINNLKSR